MVEFNRTCRQCFIEKGQSILLVKGGSGEWNCPANMMHKNKIVDDIIVV